MRTHLLGLGLSSWAEFSSSRSRAPRPESSPNKSASPPGTASQNQESVLKLRPCARPTRSKRNGGTGMRLYGAGCTAGKGRAGCGGRAQHGTSGSTALEGSPCRGITLLSSAALLVAVPGAAQHCNTLRTCGTSRSTSPQLEMPAPARPGPVQPSPAVAAGERCSNGGGAGGGK